MYKRCEAKHYNGKFNGKSFSKMTVIIILLILLALNSMGGILAYLTSVASATNNITLAGLYTVHFNANGGTGTMADQTMVIGTAGNLTTNNFTYSGQEFIGWNTLPGRNWTKLYEWSIGNRFNKCRWWRNNIICSMAIRSI